MDSVATVARQVGVTSDRDQFAGFFAEHYPAVAGYCASLVGREHADEIAQEAMAAVYARWLLVREPRAYAFRAASHLAKRHWHDRGRRDLREQVEPPTRDRDDHQATELWDVVDRLPARLRDVVLLHYVADLAVAEVALAVRRPVGTVKRRLHEARALLALALEDSDA